jgi:hypothetical protein
MSGRKFALSTQPFLVGRWTIHFNPCSEALLPVIFVKIAETLQ